MRYIFSRQAFPTIEDCKLWLQLKSLSGFYKVYSDDKNWYLQPYDAEKELKEMLNILSL